MLAGVVGEKIFEQRIAVVDPDPDFRQAFGTTNRLYVATRGAALKGRSDISKQAAARRKQAA
jgi:hypothetical protein